MAILSQITMFLDAYLGVDSVKDDSWNGLQVEGSGEVKKIMFAVDAGMMTFERAVQEGADMIVVHHGMFWRSSNPSVTGFYKKRVNYLLKNNISLYASHLPLDMHPEVGNNVQLLKILGFEKETPFGWYGGQNISFTGRSKSPKSIDNIKNVLETELGSMCKILSFGSEKIYRIAVCSGGGALFGIFNEAVGLGVDLYLTGDSTEMYQISRDIGINVIFAGHHATEIVGVRALSSVVKDKFGIDTIFVDIPTGL